MASSWRIGIWMQDKESSMAVCKATYPFLVRPKRNYVMVDPRMTTPNYLTDPFTVEFDYLANGGYAPMIRFIDDKKE